MATGLSLQLHHLRNSKKWIKKVVGFCVSVHGHSYVEMVECSWSDEDLLHMIVVSPLDKNLVAKHIKDVFREQSQVNIIKISGADLVLAPSFLHHVVGVDAVQIPSSQSIVIMSVSQNCVYKRPFSELEIKTLRRLPVTPDCAFPTSIEDLGGQQYFKFKQYSQPLLSTEVRPYIADFVEKVTHIIDRLH